MTAPRTFREAVEDPKFQAIADPALQRAILERKFPKFRALSDQVKDGVLSRVTQLEQPTTQPPAMAALSASAEPQQEPGLVESVIGSPTMGGTATGAAKGLASTALGAAQTAQDNYANPLVNPLAAPAWLAEKAGIDMPEAPAAWQALRAKLAEWREGVQPDETERLGFGAEQMGEFFLPGMAGLKAQKGMKLGTKIGAEAVGAGGVAGVQSGGDPAKTGTAVALGALGPAMGSAASGTRAFLSEKVAPKLVNSVLKPIQKAFYFGKDPGKGVAGEGIKAGTMGGLLEKIGTKKREIGRLIGGTLQSAKDKTVDVGRAITEPIERAMRKAARDGNKEVVKRLKDLREGLLGEFDIVADDIARTGAKPTKMSPLEASRRKTEIGEATKWRPSDTEVQDAVNAARIEVYRALDGAIDAAAPAVQKLNSRYANLLTAGKALERTIHIKERQALVSVPDLMAGGLGALTGLGTGGSATALALGGYGLRKALGSTASKTTIASMLAKMSPEKQGMLLKSYPALRALVLSRMDQEGDSEPSR